jgi:Xaa-Pro aminopeptidase
MKRKSRKKIGLQDYARRRRELMALMEPGSIAILPSASLKIRNGDVEFHFRQNSDFHYLTGFDEPGAVVVLIPGREHGECILFCREREATHEMWHGKVTGPERAMQLYGMDDAFPNSDIDDILPGLIEGRSRLYYAMGVDPDFDNQIIEWVRLIRTNDQGGAQPPGEFTQLELYLHELRLYKSAAEIELIRLAAAATVSGHNRAMHSVSPGMMEYELEAELLHEFAMNGARWPAYPSIVGGGNNACVLHYLQNEDQLMAGDLVLVDAAGEYENYACDVTRTFPVNGRFSPAQAEVYEIVLKAQTAAIEEIVPGNTWNQPHEAAVRALTLGLVNLGVLEGDIDELIESEAYIEYYMHKTGHWLGLDVHDVGEYQVNGQWRVFEEGMVTTIEPGLYFAEDMLEIPVQYRGIGIRIEDDVLVTKTGHEVLTADIPREVVAIEEFMAGQFMEGQG